MTLSEFKKLLDSIPEWANDFEMSPYTDIQEIEGVYIDKDGQTVWLHESPGVCTCGAYRRDEHDLDCPAFPK